MAFHGQRLLIATPVETERAGSDRVFQVPTDIYGFVRAVLEEHFDDWQVPLHGSQYERSVACLIDQVGVRVGICPSTQQGQSDLGMATC